MRIHRLGIEIPPMKVGAPLRKIEREKFLVGDYVVDVDDNVFTVVEGSGRDIHLDTNIPILLWAWADPVEAITVLGTLEDRRVGRRALGEMGAKVPRETDVCEVDTDEHTV